jgi:hypothetical protein
MARKSKRRKKSSGFIASIVVLVITFLARKILTKSYTKIMGQNPPKSGTIAMAAVEGLVQKYLGKNKF